MYNCGVFIHYVHVCMTCILTSSLLSINVHVFTLCVADFRMYELAKEIIFCYKKDVDAGLACCTTTSQLDCDVVVQQG